MTQPNPSTNSSRRDFLKTGAIATGVAGLNLAMNSRAFAAGSDELKVGLVGCGGRGTGAAQQALTADSHTRLVAVADAFPNPVKNVLGQLKANPRIATQVDVKDDFQFVGIEGYKRVVDECDVVLLASPPGFRPYHLRYAVEAGKHIFTEKPMATDAPGVRSVIQSVELAKSKKLAMVAGFCWRYDLPRREMFSRIHDGQIGDVLAIYGTYLTNPVKPMPPASQRPEGITGLEWTIRNWMNFTFLSGDGLVEQAIHTVDWLQWVMKDVPPQRCTAVGGRQIPAHGGNIYDHVEVNYEWENGVRGFVAQRQISGCHNENALTVIGTKGRARITGFGKDGVSITGEKPWKYEGPSPDMYQVEHDEFFDSIRTGKPINNGDRMVSSTLAGIMGRMAGYTGKMITWEMAMNSKELLCPEIKSFNDEVKVAPLAQPGLTQFI